MIVYKLSSKVWNRRCGLQVIADANDWPKKHRLFLLFLFQRINPRLFTLSAVLLVYGGQQDIDGSLSQSENRIRDRCSIPITNQIGRLKLFLTAGAPSISSIIRQLGFSLAPKTDFICVAASIRFWKSSALRSSLTRDIQHHKFVCLHVCT